VGIGVAVGVNNLELVGVVVIQVVGVANGGIVFGLGGRVTVAKGCAGVCEVELHPISVKSARRQPTIGTAGNRGTLVSLSVASMICIHT
jgi:hypothetical protein